MTNPPAPNALARALIDLVAASGRRPRLVLTVAAVGALASLVAALTSLEYRTRRDELVSPDKPYQQRWQRHLAEFGDDDDMVVVVEGSDRLRMEAAIERVAQSVRRQPEHFDRLFYKADLRPLRERALLMLPTEEVEAIRANVHKMGPLLGLGAAGPLAWRSLSLATLVGIGRIQSAPLALGSELTEDQRQFLTQLVAIIRAASATLEDPAAYANPWGLMAADRRQEKDYLAEPQYFFSGDGTLTFLLARPMKRSGDGFTPARSSVAAMRTELAAVRAEFPDLHIGLTGLPVLENDEMAATDRDTRLASGLALAGVALLYVLVYRNARYPLLTLLTLLAGTLWALGWLVLTIGHLNILSATFAVMLFGLGDYGVIWVTRYDQERQAGADAAEAVRRTALKAGPGIVTAAATAAAAFYLTLLADFRAVAELGWIAGGGVLLCALACVTVLPAMLTLSAGHIAPGLPGEGTGAREGFIVSRNNKSPVWLPSLSNRPRLVVAAGVALFIGLAIAATRLGYDGNLLSMQDHGLDAVRWQTKLMAHTEGASWYVVSSADTPEQARELKARYEQLPEVSRAVEVASLVPPDQGRKLFLLADMRDRLTHLPARGWEPTSDADPTLTLKAATDLRGDLQTATDPLGRELATALNDLRSHITAADPVLARERLRLFDRNLGRDLSEDLHKLREVSAPVPITLADLPPELRERYVSPAGRWLVQAYARASLWEPEPLRQFVGAVKAVDPDVTGRPVTTLEGLREMRAGFERAGLLALAVIALVLALDFGLTRDWPLALLPLAVGLTWALGLLGLFGVPITPANLIAFPLIIGVGVNYGVYVMYDFRARAAGQTYFLGRATGRGILVAALAMAISFGTLMISGHRGLFGLGLALTLGVCCCLVAALVLLPAVLRLMSEPSRAAPAERRRAA